MFETFPNAPITEGLIDIRVELPSKISVTDLEGLHTKIADTYPEKKVRRMWQATLQPNNQDQPLRTESSDDGFFFRSFDGAQVVQYRLDGFTFSRLRPYTRWEEVYPEAMRLWDLYRTGTAPIAVKRLAVRYINAIVIPSKAFDYDDYFTAAPKIPKELPQLLSGFFSRSVIPFPEHRIIANVTLAPSDVQDAVNTTVILDIDVFFGTTLVANDATIEEIFGQLRYTKNLIFFSSITEKTKELFK